ncbi:transporter substrate-binding domain-containing protein [Anoxynatronum buryatiense]|uniref:Amino acid ABC transporter substrate-binding protein, PAAT family n=1 Tax=Anoxynatronum buryatiense TaxID=489973 RepID=A0AA45WX87_9CLOT|nr:transporter substrate-binding domain-containing protein [Anoxynatronum buryatiense]SMP62835.1 amino acid ABC transporter substrate-binding protein, PAAT family [Anoxynatronum buryatiense]
MLKGKGKMMLAVLVAMLMLLTACSQPAPAPAPAPAEAGDAPAEAAEDAVDGKIADIQAAGKIVLGTSADYPPYEFIVEVDGNLEVVGFDIEIAREIANDLGVELEIRDMDFDGLLAALVAGNIDFIVAGMVPTEVRKESVDFSVPYYRAEQRFLVRAADAAELSTVEALAGKRIGAQISTVQETIATEQIPDAGELRFLSRINDLVMDLKSDRIDGLVLVGPVAASYAKADAQLAVSDISFGQEDGVAIAIAKGNDDLTEAINTTLERLMADDLITQFIAEATALADEQQVE